MKDTRPISWIKAAQKDFKKFPQPVRSAENSKRADRCRRGAKVRQRKALERAGIDGHGDIGRASN